MRTIRKTITLTDKQDQWIKTQIAAGGFTNDSEYCDGSSVKGKSSLLIAAMSMKGGKAISGNLTSSTPSARSKT